jgi:DNA-binding Lrp family transcriptional regulator
VTARRRGRARGGKDGAEPRSRVRLRELQAMQLTLEGQSQYQIAAALGISQPAVSKILRRLEDRLLADVAWKVDRQRARQTLRLEFLYAEAVRAWRASQEDAVRKRQRKSGGTGGASVAELVSENRHGDPRFLDEARRLLADLRLVWGVNAPDRLAVDATPFASLSDAALETALARQQRLLAQITPTHTS